MMMELVLERLPERGKATPGKLFVPGLGRMLYALEDAWHDNQTGISCIPEGRYVCHPHGWEENTPVKFKKVWELMEVPSRKAILIHSGNTHLDTHGCILAGLGQDLRGKDAIITQSRDAVEMLRKHIGRNMFVITIKAYKP